jgi:hypothetical protein
MALTVIKPSGTNFSNTAGTLANVNAANVTVANLTVTGTFTRPSIPLVVNDISTQFDGIKTVFPLLQDQTSINTIVDSKDVQVTLNGQILAPYVAEYKFPWIPVYDSHKGFRVKSDGNLIIYNAPYIGDQAVVMVTNISQSAQTRRYPFSATTIALGD